MKSIKILFTFCFVLCFGMSYGQIQVQSTGDVTVGTNATSSTARAKLDIPEDTPNKSTSQFGSFGIQSFNDINGFLTQNGFWNGSAAEAYTAGSVGFIQFANSKVAFRTTPTVAAGGSTTTFLNNILGTNNGRVAINAPGFSTSPAYTLHVFGDAGKTSGGSDWTVASDRRLKKNINNYAAGLNEIMQLRPVTFQYNGKGGTIDNGEVHVGLIAQEMQKISPNSVKVFEYVPMDASGIEMKTYEEQKEEFLSLENSAVRWMLVNAVKEQQAIIEALEARLAKLEKAN